MNHLFKIREQLHRIPEIGFLEKKTHKLIYEHLRKLTDLRIHTFDFPGLLVEYNGSDVKEGEKEHYLFRAEMDALPVEEKTDASFSSKHKGFMHACGHDIHLTILIGLIEYVVKEKPEKDILFLFQPAEEGKGGAERVLATGIFDNYNIKETYSLHVKPGLPVNHISCCPGIIFGIPQEFDVIFRGKSAHAANPEKGNDAVMAASHFILNTGSVIAKKRPPYKNSLFHIGRIEGGGARNIVADECKVEGTLRAFSSMDHLKQIFSESAYQSAKMFGSAAVINYLCTYDAVVNSERLYNKLRLCLPKHIELELAEPALTGEDFGFFTSRYDGLLIWLGAGAGEHDLHSPYFLPDEKAILTGLEVFKSLLNYKNKI